jgi:hypothetical protein
MGLFNGTGGLLVAAAATTGVSQPAILWAGTCAWRIKCVVWWHVECSGGCQSGGPREALVPARPFWQLMWLPSVPCGPLMVVLIFCSLLSIIQKQGLAQPASMDLSWLPMTVLGRALVFAYPGHFGACLVRLGIPSWIEAGRVIAVDR